MTVKGLRRAHIQAQTPPTWQTLGTDAEAHAKMRKDGGRYCPSAARILWGNNLEAEVRNLGEESSLKPLHGDRMTWVWLGLLCGWVSLAQKGGTSLLS